MEAVLVLARYLVEYERMVAHCNWIIEQYYQLKIPPILAKNRGFIPKTSIIILGDEELFYNFHGIGCLCKINEMIIDFDYCFGTFDYQGFETHKVWEFINSHPEARYKIQDKAIFFNLLQRLEAGGYLLKSSENSINTHDYVVSQTKMMKLLSV